MSDDSLIIILVIMLTTLVIAFLLAVLSYRQYKISKDIAALSEYLEYLDDEIKVAQRGN